MFRMSALLSIAICLGATPAWAATNQFRGVNWADSRDNFQPGVVYVSGLSSADTYSSALATGTRVMTQFVSKLGANAVRLPINEATVSSYWSTYTGAIDGVLSQGSVVLCYWDSAKANKPPNMTAFWNMWKTVVAKYGANENAYFEIFNEPNMYSTNDLIALYTSWLTQFPTVPKSRVILDGTGNAQNVPNIASASALDGCLLAVHDYSFFGSDTWKSESQWVSHFKGEVGNYADRTVCTEWGGPMSPGSKNGTSYDTLDYGKSPTNYFEAYIRGMSSQLRAWKMGSFYWAGLKDADWYSMATRSGTGPNTELSVPNPSGLAQLQNAWTGGDTTGGGTAGGGGTTGHAGAAGTVGAGAGGLAGAALGSGGGRGLAGASSVGHGGSMMSTAGASGGVGASTGIGGSTASAGGNQASFGGTGGLSMGSAGTSAAGSGRGGSPSATDADGNASTGCSCTTARGSRNSAGELSLLILVGISGARRRKSHRALGSLMGS
jgi:MYXO-CTERM domain-containing protein